MTRTQYKLAEAEFFLKHLEEHWRHVPQVDFYLSACISAARSVTWVMKNEFGKVPGWEQWYENKKPSKETRALLKTINDVRVRLTKTHPVKTSTLANVHIEPNDVTPELLEFLNSGHTDSLSLKPTDPSNTNFNVMFGSKILARAYLKNAKHEMPEFEGKDSKDVCAEYIGELRQIVRECHELFPR